MTINLILGRISSDCERKRRDCHGGPKPEFSREAAIQGFSLYGHRHFTACYRHADTSVDYYRSEVEVLACPLCGDLDELAHAMGIEQLRSVAEHHFCDYFNLRGFDRAYLRHSACINIVSWFELMLDLLRDKEAIRLQRRVELREECSRNVEAFGGLPKAEQMLAELERKLGLDSKDEIEDPRQAIRAPYCLFLRQQAEAVESAAP